MAGYEDMALYQLAKKLAIEIHQLTLNDLPKFEMYEEGSQIRRSSKSVVANFVEGYGRRQYTAEYIKFLTYSLGSCDETKAHLELLHETGSLTTKNFNRLYGNYRKPGAMIYNLRKAVINGKAT
ncbi:MAG: four helix bundle protein [Chloroflexi bacterium]|nr:MAG: four helix bundle protein [Chloroflexota bacterium]